MFNPREPIRAAAEAPALDAPPQSSWEAFDPFPAARRVYRRSPRNWYLALLAAAAMLIAGVFAWDARYVGDPDGLSYADIAGQLLRGNAGALANPYWSPLYPVLNAALIAIFRPRPEFLLPTMHAAGFLMYAIATVCFVYFIRQWVRVTGGGDDGDERFHAVSFFAWCIYLWVSLRLVGVVYPLPDLLTLACILGAAGLCCRIVASDGAAWRYGVLGAILGVGYLGKLSVAVMTIFLFAAIWLGSDDRRRMAKNLAVATAAFAVVAAPLVVATSRRVGRFSLGESGRLNYVWHVNGSPFLWTGPGGFAKGQTRVRVVSQDPLAYEFNDASGSTMPIWYDPAYWHEGVRTRFDARQILISMWRRFKEAYRAAEEIVPLLAGLVVLAGFRTRKRGAAGRHERAVRFLPLWGFLICCPFLVVHLEFRYIAGGVFLMCVAGFRALERVTDWRVFHAVSRVVGLAMLATLIGPGHRAILHAAEALQHRAPAPEHVQVAEQLRSIGIAPGSAIAVAGYGLDAYYAPVARVRVLAQLCDPETYAEVDWHDPQPSCHAARLVRTDPASYAVLRQSLRRDGFKALLTREGKPDAMPRGWIRLGDTRFWALLL